MSWKTWLLKEIPDLAEDVAAAIARTFDNVPANTASRKAAVKAAKAQVKPKAVAPRRVRVAALPPSAKSDLQDAVNAGRLPKFAKAFEAEYGMRPRDEDVSGELFGVDSSPEVTTYRLPVSDVRMPPERGYSAAVAEKYAAMPAHTAPPILVRGSELVEGGHRLRAAQLRGDTDIEVVDLGPLDDVDWPAYIAGAEDYAARPPSAPAIIRNRTGTAGANAQDVLAEAASKGKRESFPEHRKRTAGSGRELFDKSRLEQVPRVPQAQMPRVQPPRGPSSEMTRTLENPEVQAGIRSSVERGIEGGGLRWYNTAPALERMRAMMPDDEATSRYARLMDLVAATSPRSKVPDNIRTASYYNHLAEQGLPITDKPAPGYGSIAQNLHRDNARRLDEIGGWDVFKNPKSASFSTNLQGNQRNVTIDTHNMRLPAILSRDPEMLETSITEQADSPRLGLETLMRQYPGLPERVASEAVAPKGAKGASVNYKPRDWVKAGYISMDDAVGDPGLWRGKPKPNEYGHYEAWQQKQAADLGISPAQYQASMWLGAGEQTGLGSPPEAFIDTLEARVLYTADRLGVYPEVILEQFLKGDVPLLRDGGRVKKNPGMRPGS